MNTFNDRVSCLMKINGVTITGLARKLGVSRVIVSRWLSEPQCRMNAANLMNLADALNTNVAWLYDGSGSPERPQPPEYNTMSLVSKFRGMDDIHRQIVVEVAHLLEHRAST